MIVISNTAAEQIVESHLQKIHADIINRSGIRFCLKSVPIDAGWVITYTITADSNLGQKEPLLGAPPYFADKSTGEVHMFGINSDCWLQCKVYEAIRGGNPSRPWPQIIAVIVS